MNLSFIFVNKFRKKEIQHQPPGEPRAHRLGEVLQGWSKSKFNVILSLNLPLVYIFKFNLDKFQNQPPGQP